MDAPSLCAAGCVSMHEQVDGHSLDAQAVNIQEFGAAQGWEMGQIYPDAGLSAKRGSRRPAPEQLMQDAVTGQFEVVVVDKIDRFYHDLNGLLTALDTLNQRGIAFASMQEKLDFTTPWGKLMLTVLGVLAEIYLDNLRQETRKGKLQRTRDRYWNGQMPLGYCRRVCSTCTDPNGKGYCPDFGGPNKSEGKILVEHPVESVAVRLAYKWYATGEYLDAKIAAHASHLPPAHAALRI